MSLRSQLRDWAAVGRIHGDATDLAERMSNSSDVEDRRRMAKQLIDLDAQQADHLESSVLARVTSVLPPPQEIRDRASYWRAVTENPEGFR